MNIDDLTIGQAKQLSALFSSSEKGSLCSMIGKKVIVRTYSAGCWFGELSEKSGTEVILKNARRMWQWHAAKSISLSACAKYGIDQDKSKIVESVDSAWLEAIEILPCTNDAIISLEEAPHVEAK
jgi:hypothetical protein